MAVKTILIDDIDETTEGAETVDFGLDGQDYEVDLVDKNAIRLRKALEPFIRVARKKTSMGRRPQPQVKKRVSAPARRRRTGQMSTIREWAAQNGMKVSDRGKIPKDIVDKFQAAHARRPAAATKKG